MANEHLIDIMKKLLQTNSNLDFLSKLSKSELETLVVAVRNRVETIRREPLEVPINRECSAKGMGKLMDGD